MLSFIVSPYHLGQRGTGVGAGPSAILETGIAERLRAPAGEIDAGASSTPAEVNRRLTIEVRAALRGGSFPLILAGNCNSCLGTLAGLDRSTRRGIVWFDAHGDFHTPETSISGSLEGMSLMLATRDYVPEQNVVLVGARDLDPGEDERVRQRLRHIPDADLHTAVDLPDVECVYIHIDLDVLDPAISPGVNFRGSGGLTEEKLLKALDSTFQRYKVEALAIANYNPSFDIDHRTRNIAVRVIEEVSRLRQAVASR
ncbi:MAG TPA: arginase family protein [Bryobacteraceae bacterium]|nr:arginase family protein [Bryobacteraceae bacterium]